MFEKKKEERFVIKEKYPLYVGGVHIVVDTLTGVNYLMPTPNNQGGITPLLGSDGKVVIDKL